MKRKLLIVDDDEVFCRLLQRNFEGEYAVTAFSDPGKAAAYIRGNSVDVVLTDLSMPGMDGIGVLKVVKSESPGADVIIMTAYAKVESAVEAMKKGAYDYIVKPFAMDELSMQLRNLFEKRRLTEENINLRQFIGTGYRPENIIGESEAMQNVYRFIERVSQTDATVLITGESGTGKELVAKAIHFSGTRKGQRFVAVNCSAIPETLLESELFGYAQGAFSGASGHKQGLFEYADGGTIFLDEIADTPPAIQAKLLRVLQERSFMPIGSTAETKVDVRVIAATNRDPEKLIRSNGFREDLYYRINVLSVRLPALKERKEDIPLLIKRFLGDRKKINPTALSVLSHYGWPGNVREMKNLMERLATFTDADTIMPDDLPPEILRVSYVLDDEGSSYGEAKKKVLDEFNRSIVGRYLLKYGGNVTKASEELGLDRANLQRLMRRYGIVSRDFKEMNGDRDPKAQSPG
ncbi:MAG: sigma-54 dependent transcriptional regulator [Nitrospirae bacterium]|nr:sigma-54 dependent transcriptional regulator [Nitrospirota bacterium]